MKKLGISRSYISRLENKAIEMICAEVHTKKSTQIKKIDKNCAIIFYIFSQLLYNTNINNRKEIDYG